MKRLILALTLLASVSAHAGRFEKISDYNCTTDTDCMYAARHLRNDFKIRPGDRKRCAGWMDWSDKQAEVLSNVQLWCDDAGL